MVKNTIVDYIIAIKAKYEKEKLGYFHDYLNVPSPAQLRNLSLLKYEKGLNKSDREVFEKFFDEKTNLEKVIYNYPLSKLKAIESFLLGVNNKTSTQNLNLIAILLDFTPRPFNEFIYSSLPSTGKVNSPEPKEDSAEEKVDEKEAILQIHQSLVNTTTIPTENIYTEKENSILFYIKNHRLLSGAVILLIFLSCFVSIKTLIKENECMTWKKDHYEVISFDEATKIEDDEIIPLTEENEYLLKHFRKIKRCDTTTYFRNGKPCIWYWKTPDDKLDCFTAPGFHPENKKNLKAITPYMIDKYPY